LAIIFWCKVDNCFPITSYVLHMKTSVSHRLNILCKMFKIIAFFTSTLLTQQYVKVDIILTHMENTRKRGQKQKHNFCTLEPLVWKHPKSTPSFILHQESLHKKFRRTTDEQQQQQTNDNDNRWTTTTDERQQQLTNIIQLQNTKLLWLYKNKARLLYLSFKFYFKKVFYFQVI